LPPICDKQRLWKNNRIKKKVFFNFNKKLYIQTIDYKNIRKLDFCDAIAIAGSDQIWSPIHIIRKPKEAKLYFLRFIPKEKRYTYAPSFGVEYIPKELTKMYKKYICDFKQLSIREISGQKLIKDLTGLDAIVLPDPTFLLNKNEWIKESGIYVYKSIKYKYILTYFLSEKSKVLWNNINRFAQKKGFKIICVAGNKYIKGNIIPTPDEFINLINNAEAIFTDSFHGSVFSIIMETPFIVFKRSDVDQLSRINMLLNKYKMTEAFLDNENLKVNYNEIFKKEDFTQAKKVIKTERQKALDYLKQIIQ